MPNLSATSLDVSLFATWRYTSALPCVVIADNILSPFRHGVKRILYDIMSKCRLKSPKLSADLTVYMGNIVGVYVLPNVL